MYSPPSVERLKIDLTPYREATEQPGDESSDDEEDDKIKSKINA